MRNAEYESIKLRRGTLLIIFEFLARSYDEWSKAGRPPDENFVLCKPDAGERVALWRLEAAIESTLPELFAPGYDKLIEEEKRRLAAELYGSHGSES